MKLQDYPQFSETTHGIRITVTPIFLPQQSFPAAADYAWAYHVRMENLGLETMQLKTRYWKIIDAKGFVKEVRGPGVVGETPILFPGGAFEYSSGTALPTASGIMSGTYFFETENGEPREITVPAFSLDSPQEGPRQVN